MKIQVRARFNADFGKPRPAWGAWRNLHEGSHLFDSSLEYEFRIVVDEAEDMIAEGAPLFDEGE